MQRKYRKGGRGLVSITSYFIRQFCLPNPFINLFKDSNVATIVNWICGAIFIPLAYILTGSWYNGEIKFIGSFGFLVNYIFLTSIFILIISLKKYDKYRFLCNSLKQSIQSFSFKLRQ